MDERFATYRETAKRAAEMEELAFSLTLTPEEWQRCKAGVWPRDMDDRWVVGFAAPFLEMYRSWTRTLLFKLKVTVSDEGAVAGPLYAARGTDGYRQPSPEVERRLVTSIVKFQLQIDIGTRIGA